MIKSVIKVALWASVGLWVGMHYGLNHGYVRGVSDMVDVISAILDVKDERGKVHGPTEI